MKLTLFILLFSLTAHAQGFNKSIPDSESEGLVGSVRSVRIERAALTFDGDKLKETGRWLESVVTYDGRGNMTSVTSYGGNKVQRKNLYVYRRGSLSEKIEYDYGKTLHSVTKYVYVAPRREVIMLFYNARGELLPNRIISVYGEGGKVIKVIQDDGVENPLIWMLLKYGANGRPAEFIHCMANRPVKEEYEGSSICRGGEYSGKIVTQYDGRGNTFRETQYNGDGSVSSDSRYEYVYDAKGSWVQRFVFNMRAGNGDANPRASEVTHRTIRYRAAQPN